MLPKVYISYFYKVRFFQPYQVPLSTAMFDPKWYHDFKGKDHIFLDKRNVVNGVRFVDFVPQIESAESECPGPKACEHSSSNCPFLRAYYQQLSHLDYDKVMSVLVETGLAMRQAFSFTRDPEFMLLVHEAPDNPCSERRVLQAWFREHGYDLQEWTN